MSSEFLTRAFFAVLWSLMFAWTVFSRHSEEAGDKTDSPDGQRYLPYLSAVVLPVFLVVVPIIGFYFGLQTTAQAALSLCFAIFLHISIYYAILIPLLPYFRKWISARTCAMLWLLPNYLYLTEQSYMELNRPFIVLRAPEPTIWTLFFVWFTGFSLVLGWKILSHLMFRRQILKRAQFVKRPRILQLLEKEVEHAGIKKPKFKLMVSPDVAAPLSIGLFKRTTRIVLPHLNYEEVDLQLIFRHEIIHIAREDAWSKFFMTFCTAMCWFNPLMWTAMRKSADDMELSCDESVLLDADEKTRQHYASLILRTAGDERGFTTCLSAKASALRYRLKNIMTPKKKRSGALIVALTFFLLCMSCGYVSLAYSSGTGKEIIYQGKDTSQYTLTDISINDDSYHSIYDCTNETAFHAYLSSLTLCQITGNYSFSGAEKELSFTLQAPDGIIIAELSDSYLRLVPLYEYETGTAYYYLPEKTDWEYLDTLITGYPGLNLELRSTRRNRIHLISARLWNLKSIKGSTANTLYMIEDERESASGVFRTDCTEAVFDFSMEPSVFSVKVEGINNNTVYTISQEELNSPYVIPLADFSAHYTVFAQFLTEEGSVYEAEYRFDVGIGD